MTCLRFCFVSEDREVWHRFQKVLYQITFVERTSGSWSGYVSVAGSFTWMERYSAPVRPPPPAPAPPGESDTAVLHTHIRSLVQASGWVLGRRNALSSLLSGFCTL